MKLKKTTIRMGPFICPIGHKWFAKGRVRECPTCCKKLKRSRRKNLGPLDEANSLICQYRSLRNLTNRNSGTAIFAEDISPALHQSGLIRIDRQTYRVYPAR